MPTKEHLSHSQDLKKTTLFREKKELKKELNKIKIYGDSAITARLKLLI
jgi:hypothetical protein